MNALQMIASLATVFISLPIWYYLLYQVLLRVDATELMFFLFWVYVPAGLFVSLVNHLAKKG